MAITVNLYYTGENGNARKFAEEMLSSGTVHDLHMKIELYKSDDEIPEKDKTFIRK